VKLARLQHSFADALLDPESPAPAFESLITGPSSLQPARRVEIYRGNTLGALGRALENLFPVCRRIVGEACFGGLSRLYILRTPPTQHDLSLYGDAFPGFLEDWMKGRPEWSDFAYLGDLARLERYHHLAWRAADDRAFDFRAFEAAATADAGAIRFTLSASLGLLRSVFPADEIWTLNQEDTPASDAVPAAQDETHLAVLRRRDQVAHLRLTPAQFRVLEASDAGSSLDVLATLELPASEPLDATISHLIAQGPITGFHRANAEG
jgi:hypothetical protein